MKKTLVKLCWLLFIFVVGITSMGCPARKPFGGEDVKQHPQEYEEEPTISLFINETGEKKQVKLEEYLEGVVAAEMDPTWPDGALAAQAILARTFTLKKIKDGGVKAHGTDASTDVEEFQAYDPTKINDKVKKAVKDTRGKVLVHNGKYINAWFFADGGGKTSASAVEGLAYDKEKTPYIKMVEDPGFKITEQDNKSWSAKFPLDQVKKAIMDTVGKDLGHITSASISKTGPSGRATKVKINDIELGAPALRLALGSEKMRSTLIDSFAINNGMLVITGKGYGHGVGMSQWGARALAEQGKSPEEIVNYWFKDVQLKQLWK